MADATFVIPGTLENKEIIAIDAPDREALAKHLVNEAFDEILASNPNLVQLEEKVKAISPEIPRGIYSNLLDIQVELEEMRAFASPSVLKQHHIKEKL
jgi:hypothetical protein